ncbi:insulin-like growth factor 1 receptor isoform X1 [Zerene cesonia]|uniref:insulin-like growth factor 1 receptor isoform X1 n=1 Tax=Zerene cesonia TaxID=33412 RepID=UPI0018E59005|nr:insulin-like growth factor 1 receptor isoform X1 [Zerene cesonia]
MRRAGDWVAWPAAACVLLLACDCACAIEMVAPGICPSIDIRNNLEKTRKLQECRVIEGNLNIVLMEHVTHASFENFSFPHLREVTGYVLIYRLRRLRNLGDLFPNLSVIRGLQLFKDFALVIFDNEGLESLGLRSLSRIERGAVRIQNNDRLCYVNTIDWSKIVAKTEHNIIGSNYDTRLCGLCPHAQSRMKDRQDHMQCPADSSGRLLCWDENNCQKRDCPSACGDRGCYGNDTCCHSTCLGGCDGPLPSDCHVCANFSFRYGAERTCMERCPANTYQLARRCVTEQECRSMPVPPGAVGLQAPNIKAYKILNNEKCVYVCPSGYIETGEPHNSQCEPCPQSGCQRECEGGNIDSISAAEKFRGCTHILGNLEIVLRASGGNTMTVLESTLGEIREITGALRVIRSYPLVSLMFLKNLQRIGGGPNIDNKPNMHSLYIFNNPNLEMLWEWTPGRQIEISSGRLFIHFNPKLCYDKIEKLRNMTRDPASDFSSIEVSPDNNGDQASCLKDTLELKVFSMFKIVGSSGVLLTWNMYCPEDMRQLLGYSIYYIQAEQNVTIYGQRDACSDIWSVRDIPLDEVRNATAAPKSKENVLSSPCDDLQPLFHPLSYLTPYTRYAAYVKTYTTSQYSKGAQSPIIYFTTLPGPPSPPTGLTASVRQHSATISWSPPSMPNGTIALYRVEIQANAYNHHKILTENLNYCNNPSVLANVIAVRGEEVVPKKEDKSTGDVKSGTCACKEEPEPAVRFTSVAEEERVESIYFENELQNFVYVKNRNKVAAGGASRANRTRRSIASSLNSMLVILSDTHAPGAGLNYSNETDGTYVKSLYYELSGDTHSLTVDNLRHFTWYTVNIWACRKKEENESCSTERAYYNFRTLERLNVDVVRKVRAEVVPSNKTLSEVNVTWLPPEDPNGFVVAYNVYHSRVEDSAQTQDVGVTNCISANDYENYGRGFLMRNLAAGNYSIRVTPLTVSGVGNVSSEIFVFIPEVRLEGGYEWVWGVVGGCAVVACAAAAGAWWARRARTHDANKLFASVNPEYVSTVYVPDEWEVPRASIEFVRELGQGSFGMVYEGVAKNIEKGKPETRCAVKTVNEHATDRERIEFLNEASVMKAFDTFHVVRLLGVVSRGQPTLVVMELMEHGDLKTYLRSHRPDADNQPAAPPTLQNILQMAIEIADGMAYLSAKKFVHRDLAARNCMVAGDLTVKVGDFGMTRDIYETDYYRKGTKGLLPVRWMSPESLKDGVFSSNTDVWSYGVVLWEMATLAMQPYQGLSNEQVVRYVVEGGVMERPEHCPDRLYELMRACWAHRPAARPSFLQLVADLAPSAQPYFRHRSFFHTPQGQEMYALQRTAAEEEQEMQEVNVGAVATGSGSNLFGVSGRIASWVRELSSLRSRTSDDAAAEPLQPLQPERKAPPNGTLSQPPC